MRGPSDRRFSRLIASPGSRSVLLCLSSAVAFLNGSAAPAGVYKCVGADGTPTYSDSACESKPEHPMPPPAPDPSGALGAARRVPVVTESAAVPVSSLDRKIHELLLLTQLSTPESPSLPDLARSLVPRVDPKLSAAPQDPRWGPVSNMIQGDIRWDVRQLEHSFANADQSLVGTLASRMQEADIDALSNFFRSPTGASYLQFQSEMRTVYAGAVRSVLGHVATQTPILQSSANAAVLRTRLTLVTLAVDAANLLHAQDAAHNVNDPSPYAFDGILPKQITAVEGPALDDLAAKYETSLAAFGAFNDSPITRRFFAIVGQPIAAKAAEIDAATTKFSDVVTEKYGTRWKAAYRRGIYAVTVTPGTATVVSAGGRGSGPTPQIRSARYVSWRNGRSIDVTYALQSACPPMSGSCRIPCGNQLAGDPDFGQRKFCQISYQCPDRPMQDARVGEGGNLTLVCMQ